MHLGSGDGRLTTALCRDYNAVVQGLDTDDDQIAIARKHIHSKGKYGQVSVRAYDGEYLPLKSNLVNLLVTEDRGQVSMEEIYRVLAPLGVAYMKQEGVWEKFEKPRPDDTDDWTHYLYDASGNPVSNDKRVGVPERIQWMAGPYISADHEEEPGLHAMVVSNGRIFYIHDESDVKFASLALPRRYVLVARDAYNGMLLWKKPMTNWGWQEWKTHFSNWKNIPLQLPRRLVAIGDDVYVTMGFNAPVSKLDAATGKILHVYEDSDFTDEIILTDGKLIVAVNPESVPLTQYNIMPRPEEFKPKSIIAYNAVSGEKLWRYSGAEGTLNTHSPPDANFQDTPEGEVAGRVPYRTGGPFLNLAAGDGGVCFLNNDRLSCLDMTTGSLRWEALVEDRRVQVTGGGLRITNGVVSLTDRRGILSFSMEDGKRLWDQSKGNITWYTWRDAFTRDSLTWIWSAETDVVSYQQGGKELKTVQPLFLEGYQTRSGELLRQHYLGDFYAAGHHHRCYQNKASSDMIITGRLGTEFVHMETGDVAAIKWLRGECQYGLTPANGMLYAPPHPCWCYTSALINGFNALTSGDDDVMIDPQTVRPVMLKGPAFGQKINVEDLPGDSEWPVFRANNLRAAANTSQIGNKLSKHWEVAFSEKLSAPICVNDKVMFSLVDAHRMICLSAKTGKLLWEYTAEARIDSPPACYGGFAVFGSADGSVYAVNADDGTLVWRFKSHEKDYFIAVDNQLESLLPVHGSVLIEENIVYFAAGRNAYLDLGVYVYGLDLETGEVLYSQHYRFEQDENLHTILEEKIHITDGVKTDIPVSDGDSIYIHTNRFDKKLTVRIPDNDRTSAYKKFNIRMFHDFTFGDYAKRTSWALPATGDRGQLINMDGERSYVATMVEKYTFLTAVDHFIPASGGFIFYARQFDQKNKTWSQRIPVIPRAMAVTSNYLLVSGSPDVIDQQDPLLNYEYRGKGMLLILSKLTGEPEQAYTISSVPVFNGIAVTSEYLVLTMENGTVSCYQQE